MAEILEVEKGSMGRVAYARIAPNEDLLHGVEKLCLSVQFKNAFVRGALGSLVDGCVLRHDGEFIHVRGPAVEIVSIAGEVRSMSDGSVRASLSGVIADTSGKVYGGPLVAGLNPVCMTFEITLEEWLPESAE
jgi:predicted DNA-binding protein with PD1-like motif